MSREEDELIYRIGRVLEKIGIYLIKDDYKDINQTLSKEEEEKRLIPNFPFHHWQYGDLLIRIGQEVQKESGYKEDDE